jgi:hypothetical protein
MHLKKSFHRRKKESPALACQAFCRGDWTRTSGLVVPNDARYQLRHTPIIKFSFKGGLFIPNPE